MPNISFSQADSNGLVVVSSSGIKFFIDPASILNFYKASKAQDPKQDTSNWVAQQIATAFGASEISADQIGIDFDEATGIPLQCTFSNEQNPDDSKAPTIAIVNPVDGEGIFSGVMLQAKAQAATPNTVSSVTFTILGVKNPIAALLNVQDGYYEVKWDSTAVPDGKTPITATVTDNAGNSVSVSITVVVKN